MAAKPQGYQPPRSLAAERAWLLERLATKPDVTPRGLVVELGAHGVVTSCGSVWLIVRKPGSRSKKYAVRPRAGQAGDRPQARAVAQRPRPG